MTLYLNGTTGISGVDGSAGTPAVQGTDTNTGISFPAADTIAFNEGGAEVGRFDSSGRLLVGTSTSPGAGNGSYSNLVVGGQPSASTSYGNIAIVRNQAASALVTNSGIGGISFCDNTGGTFADILCAADATPGSNDFPGRLVFSTCADGASSPTERMRINADGNLLVNTTSVLFNQNKPFFATNLNNNEGSISQGYQAAAGYFNRQGNDGTIINLLQDGNIEGTISVSGTTVSYNGAHLSRWSQLPGGVERTDILRGSVLSNLDEMCEWGDEDNEQLNRMKVSDVEGDKNVSGVFQAWDDDDDTYTNDFYCAMTGDFIIRIAAGVTVERGDLLMSAGDGTAKPQDDDIIRSKTIAKVTSTNVSCTYDDGSYCVPCVLMAC